MGGVASVVVVCGHLGEVVPGGEPHATTRLTQSSTFQAARTDTPEPAKVNWMLPTQAPSPPQAHLTQGSSTHPLAGPGPGHNVRDKFLSYQSLHPNQEF